MLVALLLIIGEVGGVAYLIKLAVTAECLMLFAFVINDCCFICLLNADVYLDDRL